MGRSPVVATVVLAVVLVAAGSGCSRRGSNDGASGVGSVPAAVGGSGGPSTTTPSPPVQPAVAPRGSTVEHTIHTADGRDRTYHLYVPASVPADGPAPLLVALHGGTGWGTQYEANSGFDGLAEANGFLVAYPDGISIPLLATSRVWNGGTCCGPAAADKQNVDDVAFIAAVVDEIEAAHRVDHTRVFATGHSNGAIMSFRLACELADRIVAIGVQAGTLGVDDCHPSDPVAVLEIHGTADANIPIAGGTGDGLSSTDFRPPLDALETFVAANGCPPDPTGSVDPVNPDVVVDTWAPCDAGTAVQWVKVTGANHAWMGHPAASVRSERLVGAPYPSLDSSLTIWTFLAAHPRPSGGDR
jgi:polyhydroxybutyrate depolymerase